MKHCLNLAIGVFLILTSLTVQAQESKLDSGQSYRLLDTVKVSTMQTELEQSAAAGYRVRAGLGRNILLLEKAPAPPAHYEYALPDTNEKSLNEAGASGFRLLPQPVGMNKGTSGLFGGFSRGFAGLVMEKQPGSETSYEYKILATTRTSTMEKELAEASQQGYQIVAITKSDPLDTGSGEHMLILEKGSEMPAKTSDLHEDGSADAMVDRYRLLSTTKTSTMQEELDEAAAAGYRVLDASDSELAIALKKAPEGEIPRKYLLLSTGRTSTMQKELNEGARNGFRLLPQTLGAIEKKPMGGLFGSVQTEIFATMEKTPSSNSRYEYILLATKRSSTMEKEVAEASQKGLRSCYPDPQLHR